MSFQAYHDKVEDLTGKTPNDFIAEARNKNLTTSKEILAWLKQDYGLGLGHARAISYVILHGAEFTVRQTTGTHRDASGTLNLAGKKVAAKKTASRKVATKKPAKKRPA